MTSSETTFNDKELIARWDDYVESMGSVMGEVEHMAQQMRDRIEQLSVTNEALTKERDEAVHLARMRKTFTEEARDERDAAEAKLAKAVEALEDIVKDCEADYPPSHGAIKYFARATLAEIKGGNDAKSDL